MKSIELRVVTFNIRFPSEHDEGNLWKDRRSIVADLFAHLDADVVCMQEAYRKQLHDVVSDSPRYASVGWERRGETDEEHNPILMRANRFMIESSGTFWLSDNPETPGSREWMPEDHPRVVTWARINDLATAQRVLIANTHFPLGDESLRARSAELILKRIGGESIPTILCGDFNAVPDSAPYRILTGNDAASGGSLGDFTDSWTTVADPTGPSATFHRFTGQPKHENHRIDWILCRNGVQARKVETVVFNRGGKYPSDHFPVCADLVIEDADTEGR